ncbi:ribose 5-phosphate isomerase B [Paenibacillus sp. URB8-2]|uniref:ribose 5-phosphate isomerase B n=1 Tax=Paenibacillus sp. URB8-2 TaxID=2741301 RepID=UPI0015C15645|nr:ribose 5-phosphate isomerase B [Paenibacillus sp. URB8-2]BCG60460.1 ribose 5-phosphate isomerase B [Paenibacillus sp. URB8-2]
MKIAIASDHIGFELKPIISAYVEELGHELIDYGPHSAERTDYPKYAKLVAEALIGGQVDAGILICGTGVGISIAANKVRGIRAVVCSEPYTAQMSKRHNNTNILAFGSRVIGGELAKMIVKCWLEAEFEGGRHVDRVGMIGEIEEQYLC